MVAPLQDGDRLNNGVRVAVRFSSGNRDNSCAFTAAATWHNLDTGASDVITRIDSQSGGRYGNAGYNRAHSGPAREQWSSLSAHTAQRASGRQVTV